MQPNI